MTEINCEIIKDLLPSYADNVCSEASKNLVEDHLSACPECRGLAQRMKGSEISAERTEQKQIDYLKKVRKHILTRDLLGLSLLIFFTAAGLAIIISNYGSVPLRLYYLILPVLALASYFLLPGRQAGERTKGKAVLTSISLLLLAGSLLLQQLMARWAEGGVSPRLAPDQAGPLIYRLFLCAAVLQTALYLTSLVLAAKTSTAHTLLMTTSLTGATLSLSFISILKRLTSAEAFSTLRPTVLLVFLAEGALLTALLLFLDRVKGRRTE